MTDNNSFFEDQEVQDAIDQSDKPDVARAIMKIIQEHNCEGVLFGFTVPDEGGANVMAQGSFSERTMLEIVTGSVFTALMSFDGEVSVRDILNTIAESINGRLFNMASNGQLPSREGEDNFDTFARFSGIDLDDPVEQAKAEVGRKLMEISDVLGIGDENKDSKIIVRKERFATGENDGTENVH